MAGVTPTIIQACIAATVTEQIHPLLQVLYGVNQRLCVEDVDSPLCEVRPVKTVLLVVLTGDRGLCGGYNNFIIKRVSSREGWWQEWWCTSTCCSGWGATAVAAGADATHNAAARGWPCVAAANALCMQFPDAASPQQWQTAELSLIVWLFLEYTS